MTERDHPTGQQGLERPGGAAPARDHQARLPVVRRELEFHASFEYFQGPIPPPQVIRDYEKVLPGAAERIFALAERQAAHRQRFDSRGQALGFLVAITAVAGGLLLLAFDKPLTGVAGAIAAVSGLAALFAWERAWKKRQTPPDQRGELVPRRPIPPSPST